VIEYTPYAERSLATSRTNCQSPASGQQLIAPETS
jgi:hypothetical protein